MNKVEHLLSCLIEECAEIQKEATKASRFGLEHSNPEDKESKTNIKKIRHELIDLWAVVDELREHGVDLRESGDIYREKFKRKKLRLKKYMNLAVKLGTIKEDDSNL